MSLDITMGLDAVDAGVAENALREAAVSSTSGAVLESLLIVVGTAFGVLASTMLSVVLFLR